MATTDFKSVDEYLASLPPDVQTILQRVRTAILEALPEAEEAISYQIPTVKLRGTTVLYFAGWKRHFSIYPVTADLIEAFGDALAPYKMSKGTIQFPLSQPVPTKLIARLAKFRAKEALKGSRASPDR